MKNASYTIIVLLFSIVGANHSMAQSYTEGPWSYDRYQTGTSVCSTNSYASYDDLNGSQWVTPVFFQNSTYGVGITGNGNCGGNQNFGIYVLYTLTENVPAYTKRILSNTIKVIGQSTGLWHTVAAYKFNTYSDATTTAVDFTYNMGRSDKGSAYRITYTYSQGTETSSGNSTISYSFDNSTGNTSASFSRYLLVTDVLGQSNAGGSFNCSGSFKSVSTSWDTYYYKIITFDANEGTGSIASQTIENSGNLTSNNGAITRAGYRFTGWNTTADGKGTSYSDGASITVTSESKGPVTLYAQWETIAVHVTVAGYATVFSDKKLIVPFGVEVYGFLYINGMLVQQELISQGSILPANKGYLVKATPGIYNFAPTSAEATAYESELSGSIAEIDTPSGDIYVWGKPEGYGYGWYKYTGAKITAGKAFFLSQNRGDVTSSIPSFIRDDITINGETAVILLDNPASRRKFHCNDSTVGWHFDCCPTVNVLCQITL